MKSKGGVIGTILKVIGGIVVGFIALAILMSLFSTDDSPTTDSPRATVQDLSHLIVEECQAICHTTSPDFAKWKVPKGDEMCVCLDKDGSVLQEKPLISEFEDAPEKEELELLTSRFKSRCKTFCRFKQRYGYQTRTWFFPSSGKFGCSCLDAESGSKIGSTSVTFEQLQLDEKKIKRVLPYIDPIKTADVGIRAIASKATESCGSQDYACQVNGVYRYVVENHRYVNDPLTQIVQKPEETLKVEGGDCEDFTILMNSMLENLGIETAVVLTPGHAYGVACNIDTVKLKEVAYQSLLEYQAKKYSESSKGAAEVIGDAVWWKTDQESSFAMFGGGFLYQSISNFDTSRFSSASISYKVSAPFAINVYVFPSDNDRVAFEAGSSFQEYSSCRKNNVVNPSSRCDGVGPGAVILAQRLPGSGSEQVLKLETTRLYKFSESALPDPVEISTYDLGGRDCVVLDGTLGPYGYPGRDASVDKDRLIVGTTSKQVWDLSSE
jgi:hypothetical protein